MSDAIMRVRSAVDGGELEMWGDWTDVVREAMDMSEGWWRGLFERHLRAAAEALDTTIAERALEIAGEDGYWDCYVSMLGEEFDRHVRGEIEARRERECE